MKVFVLVSYARPSDGAISGTMRSQEVGVDAFKADFSPERDKDLFDFLEAAQVGEYFNRNGGMFVFRSR